MGIYFTENNWDNCTFHANEITALSTTDKDFEDFTKIVETISPSFLERLDEYLNSISKKIY